MTYHALENRLRKWKKEAIALKDEAAGVAAPAKSSAKPRVQQRVVSHNLLHIANTFRMPSLQLLTDETLAVKSGRITKKKAPAGPKIKSGATIDEEAEEDSMLLDGPEADVGAAVGGGDARDDLDDFI
jgi:hypothetical protein